MPFSWVRLPVAAMVKLTDRKRWRLCENSNNLVNLLCIPMLNLCPYLEQRAGITAPIIATESLR